MADEYNASKIIVLEGPEGIRKRPAMYIGSTGINGLLHLLFEVIDNAVDEALAGYANKIDVKIEKDVDSVDIAEVSDNGRGIPVDTIPKYNKSALEVIMTTLHKGAKFNNDVYKVSGGLHGVGLTVVNALSEFVEVTVKRDGKIYRQRFSKGNVISNLEIIGETNERGTTVRFKPDKEIFQVVNFDYEAIKERLRNTAFLNKGIRLTLKYYDKEPEEFYSEKGILDFLDLLSKEKTKISNDVYAYKKVDDIVVEFAFRYVNSYDELVKSFVNSIETPEGGTHFIGFRSGLARAITSYMQKNQIKSDAKIEGDDTREGLVGIISILMPNPEFEGQTKEKLGNTKIKNIVESIVYDTVYRYLEEHPNDAKMIIEKVISAAIARESAKKARELARKKSIFESNILPGKLADCSLDDPSKTELFIVEGESAGGSSKQGRDKNIQAILPLRGKILNVEKASPNKIFNNEEIRAIITACGTGVGEQFNINKLRYGKIIIMSDADVDGSHIRALLLTFFYRYMPELIKQGHIYVAQPPLYKLTKGKEIYYFYSDDSLQKKLNELGNNVTVQRFKGLGEMNPQQLWETTMNPETRIIKQINIEDAKKADELFTILMGLNVAKRRAFLEEHAHEVQFLDV